MIPKVNKHVSLEGKTAMITGAASGIGLATAKRLSEVGASIALLDINKNVGRKEESQLQLHGRNARFFQCDVTSSSDCNKVTKAVIKEFNKIDILFNNAGIIRRKNTVDLNEEEWDLVMNVNLKSIYLLSHEVIPHMIENGSGTIINTGSGWGLKGGPDAVAYCAAKGGIVNMTRAMAIDHGKHNIRVNCVCPGDVDTPLLQAEAAQLGFDESEFLKDAADRPLGRIGLPEDVANAVLYLASDMSSWVSGAILLVDGGGLA
jgi:NAD(P)-dependent dehydrogenase (short-subunit alcohol dehydrogenase family)